MQAFFHWGGYGQVRDYPNWRQGWLEKESNILHHLLSHAERVLRVPRHRKRIWECSQRHTHSPGNECRQFLHQPKQRRHNGDVRGLGNYGLPQLRQKAGLIIVGCKIIRSKHELHIKWPKNNRTMRQTISTTEVYGYGAPTNNDNDEISNTNRRSTFGKPQQTRKTWE